MGLSREYDYANIRRPTSVPIYDIWRNNKDDKTQDCFQSILRLFAGPIVRTEDDGNSLYFFDPANPQRDNFVSGFIKHEKPRIRNPPNHYVFLGAYLFEQPEEMGRILRNAGYRYDESSGNFIDPDFDEYWLRTKRVLSRNVFPTDERYEPYHVNLFKSAVVLGIADIPNSHLKPAAHSMIDGYDKIVHQIDDVNFPYAKKWIEEMHDCVEELDMDSLSIMSYKQLLFKPINNYVLDEVTGEPLDIRPPKMWG